MKSCMANSRCSAPRRRAKTCHRRVLCVGPPSEHPRTGSWNKRTFQTLSMAFHEDLPGARCTMLLLSIRSAWTLSEKKNGSASPCSVKTAVPCHEASLCRLLQAAALNSTRRSDVQRAYYGQRSICQSFQSRLREMSSRPDWTRQTPLFLVETEK